MLGVAHAWLAAAGSSGVDEDSVASCSRALALACASEWLSPAALAGSSGHTPESAAEWAFEAAGRMSAKFDCVSAPAASGSGTGLNGSLESLPTIESISQAFLDDPASAQRVPVGDSVTAPVSAPVAHVPERVSAWRATSASATTRYALGRASSSQQGLASGYPFEFGVGTPGGSQACPHEHLVWLPPGSAALTAFRAFHVHAALRDVKA